MRDLMQYYWLTASFFRTVWACIGAESMQYAPIEARTTCSDGILIWVLQSSMHIACFESACNPAGPDIEQCQVRLRGTIK